jgi:hypothetical protein
MRRVASAPSWLSEAAASFGDFADFGSVGLIRKMTMSMGELVASQSPKRQRLRLEAESVLILIRRQIENKDLTEDGPFETLRKMSDDRIQSTHSNRMMPKADFLCRHPNPL